MLNLENAIQLYLLLKPYLYEPDEEMLAEMYILSIVTAIHTKKEDRIIFEVIALGTGLTAEDCLEYPTETLLNRFTQKLADNNVLALKKFFEELTNES